MSNDMTVINTAIVCILYIMLEYLHRKGNNQKIICELFYVYCDDIKDMELITALKQLLEILVSELKNRAITILKEIKSQLINWFISQPAFIRTLYSDFGQKFKLVKLPTAELRGIRLEKIKINDYIPNSAIVL